MDMPSSSSSVQLPRLLSWLITWSMEYFWRVVIELSPIMVVGWFWMLDGVPVTRQIWRICATIYTSRSLMLLERLLVNAPRTAGNGIRPWSTSKVDDRRLRRICTSPPKFKPRVNISWYRYLKDPNMPFIYINLQVTIKACSKCRISCIQIIHPHVYNNNNNNIQIHPYLLRWLDHLGDDWLPCKLLYNDDQTN